MAKGLIASLPTWETLSLQQQIAQMVVVRASGHLFDHQIEYPVWEPPNSVLQRWVQELGVGGVILLGGTAAEVGLRTHQLQDWATIPLLVAADIEEGVGQRFAGATWFPPPMALSQIAKRDQPKAIDLAFQMGSITAQEAAAIGLNWVLAPVVDVNNNPANPVINVRSFGDDAAIVSPLISAFIRGARQFPVLTSAKHFPGHGDTAIDSHLELPVILHDRTRLEEIEFAPFRESIAAGVDSVMTAHLQLPALDRHYPATLSQPILTGILRQQMNFQGLIVTDALIMGAITQAYGANEAPILALEAGADILLMPADPEGAIEAICAAVEAGRIPLERINASLDRIWRAKQKVSTTAISGSSHAWEQIPPPPIDLDHLAKPEAIDCAAGVLRDSMTVYCPPDARLGDRRSNEPRRNLVLLDDMLNCNFLRRQAPAITLPAHWGYKLQVIDQNLAGSIAPGSQPPIPTLLQLFIRGNPFRSSAGLTQTAKHWLMHLLQTNQLLGLVIYGSPYVMESLVSQLPAEIPYGFTYGQMPLAQAIVLGELGGESGRSVRNDEFTD
ncbi:MAG TPA: glycoside hydrolase family 3 N-terminal domain-containing protein [Trichocoleus sp.]